MEELINQIVDLIVNFIETSIIDFVKDFFSNLF
jgi:hypothetical protein